MKFTVPTKILCLLLLALNSSFCSAQEMEERSFENPVFPFKVFQSVITLVTPPTVEPGQTITLKARLTDSDTGTPLVNVPLDFMVAGGQADILGNEPARLDVYKEDNTDANGWAEVTYKVSPREQFSASCLVYFEPFLIGDALYPLNMAGGTLELMVRSQPIPTVQLSNPVNASSGVSRTPTLKWTAVAGAQKYHLVLTKKTGQIVKDVKTSSTSWKPNSTLAAKTTYVWKIQAVMPNGKTGSFSKQWQFTTGTR
jgi:hypothetical protein